MRRQFYDVDRGQVYCVEWPEWHVDCAQENCNEHILVSPLGESLTTREAQKVMRLGKTEDDSSGWSYKKGRWFCPQHG